MALHKFGAAQAANAAAATTKGVKLGAAWAA